MAVCNFADAIPVGGVASKVRRENGAGLGCDHRFDPLEIEIQGERIDVNEGRDQTGANEGCNVS